MTDYSQVDASILQERQRILKIIEDFENALNELLTTKSKISFTDESIRDEYNHTIGGIAALELVRMVINL